MYTANLRRVDEYTVKQSSDVLGYVVSNAPGVQKQRIVNINERTCSCGKWYQLKIPCTHAFAFASEVGELNTEEKMKRFLKLGIDKGYLLARYIRSLRAAKVQLFQKEDLIADKSTLPNKNLRSNVGPPKKRRRNSRGEFYRK